MTDKHQLSSGQLGLDSDSESNGSMQAAELKMREALGLNGRGDRPAPRPQSDQPRSNNDRPSGDRPNGNGHRHRFVQDGEVPVVMAKHAVPGGAASAARGAGPPAATNRLASLSAELGLERSGRERAERALQQAQAMLRDFQTKLAHAELARTEAAVALKAEQEIVATMRATQREQVDQIAALRAARDSAEHALPVALAAPPPPPKLASVPKLPRGAGVKKTAVARKVREPKPVRWWIRSEPAAK